MSYTLLMFWVTVLLFKRIFWTCTEIYTIFFLFWLQFELNFWFLSNVSRSTVIRSASSIDNRNSVVTKFPDKTSYQQLRLLINSRSFVLFSNNQIVTSFFSHLENTMQQQQQRGEKKNWYRFNQMHRDSRSIIHTHLRI